MHCHGFNHDGANKNQPLTLPLYITGSQAPDEGTGPILCQDLKGKYDPASKKGGP
jgi:hypothetical protein